MGSAQLGDRIDLHGDAGAVELHRCAPAFEGDGEERRFAGEPAVDRQTERLLEHVIRPWGDA